MEVSDIAWQLSVRKRPERTSRVMTSLSMQAFQWALAEDLLVPSPFTAVLPSLKVEDTLRRNLTSGPLLSEGVPSSPHFLTSLLLLL